MPLLPPRFRLFEALNVAPPENVMPLTPHQSHVAVPLLMLTVAFEPVVLVRPSGALLVPTRVKAFVIVWVLEPVNRMVVGWGVTSSVAIVIAPPLKMKSPPLRMSMVE